MKTRAVTGGTAPDAVRTRSGCGGSSSERHGVNKTYRQGQILRLIKTRKIHTQDQLAQELAAAGYCCDPGDALSRYPGTRVSSRRPMATGRWKPQRGSGIEYHGWPNFCWTPCPPRICSF